MTITASVDHKSTGSGAFAPVRAVCRLVVAMAEAWPQMHALNRIGHLSDRQLAAKGLTREGEVRRILGAAAAL